MGGITLRSRASGKVEALGRELLAVDLEKANTAVIAGAIGKLSRSARQQLLAKLDILLRGASRKSETERVGAAKLFVALLPDSLGHIEKWLRKKGDRWHYEIHFSLFCFLDDSVTLTLEPKVLGRIETLIVQYLEVAKSDTAQAAWMAADLLGHHWPGRAAFHALMSLAKQGRHVEGRKAALSGLQRRLEDQAESSRLEIVETLEKVASSDPSPLIRLRAERLLEKAKH